VKCAIRSLTVAARFGRAARQANELARDLESTRTLESTCVLQTSRDRQGAGALHRACPLLFLLTAAAAAQPRAVTVAANQSGDFATVGAALDSGAAILRIKPGIYKEVLRIERPGVQLRGLGAKAEDIVLTYDNSSATAGGTTQSASVTVSGDDFYAENLTFENSYSRTRPLTQQGSQAVAIKITGDRAVFRRVRFLGYQDTLYANSKRCTSDAGPCVPARQYFSECYIEGNVDFIFGDAMAFFDRCEIRALAHSLVYLTAQSKHYAEEKSGYVFNHCRITTEDGAARVYLGRPWRAYSTVVFLDTEMPRAIVSEGWHEWEHDGKPSLPTSFYAERGSAGPGAKPDARRQLAPDEAARFALKLFLAGDDQWDPTKVH
jgi:pectin methylesterase-like acyl-CoA thioesterase